MAVAGLDGMGGGLDAVGELLRALANSALMCWLLGFAILILRIVDLVNAPIPAL